MSTEKEKHYGTFHDVETNEITTRELTQEEVDMLTQATPPPIPGEV